MSEVKTFVLVPNELWETRKRNYQRSIKKRKVFPVIKKAKEVNAEETDRPPKELKTDLEFTIRIIGRH